ncbi:pentatricopeptide repeat-containing protein 1, mitochondrial-like [Oppia nitens]|uniref:pentatricopeptide repeat-containing protein 1, mitochondrial-like n=1 Tax=Oppia nitens TaxID=1686743 RepID=UPI0023DBDE7D|nr:pentatricopeptide repeat-containing protein 1, mitochondrial-like [Oppia nitens]
MSATRLGTHLLLSLRPNVINQLIATTSCQRCCWLQSSRNLKTKSITRQSLEPLDELTDKVVVNKLSITRQRTEEPIGFDARFGDTFGTLGGNDVRYKTRLAAEDLPDDDDKYDVLEIKRGSKKADIWYRKQLNKLIKQKPIQITKALELYNKMISEDRIPPEKTLYTLLINGCAKVGYTRKAFDLLDEMLKYEIRPSHQAITALFNACAECPFPEFGLEKTRYMRQWMNENRFIANTYQYHAMIKAYGKLGDMKSAVEVVNEMVANGQTTTDETFAMLLIGCISNKQSGLYDAIKMVHRMMSHRTPLTIYTFNLLLRAVRDCGIGSEENLKLLIERSSRPIQEPNVDNRNKKMSKLKNKYKYKDKTDKRFDNISNNELSKASPYDTSLIVRPPNLLMQNSLNESNIISIEYNSLTKASNRFMLLGGVEGFIRMMIDSDVIPTINTMTLMTELIDFANESEDVLLKLFDTYRIKIDTDFFNILIKHVCYQRGSLDAKRIYTLMTQRDLKPDIVTFGVLSLTCNNYQLGKQLLADMDQLSMKANIQILGALVNNACKANNFSYINHIIDYMIANEINPDKKFVEKLEMTKLNVQNILAKYDWNNTEIDINPKFKSQRFREEFSLFKDKYYKWIKKITLDEAPHPWYQFQFEELDNKKKMHSFVKFMKQKIAKRRELDGQPVDELADYEEDELYDD